MPNQKKHGNPPVCVVCGELIPLEDDDHNYRWIKRTVCRPSYDTKNVKCATLFVREGNKQRGVEKRGKPNPKQSKVGSRPAWKKLAAAKPKIKTLSEQERERLDAEQARLNVEIAKSLDARHGYGHGPVISIPVMPGMNYQPPIGNTLKYKFIHAGYNG